MKLMFFLLQTGAAAAAPQGSNLTFLLFIALMFVVMYFFMIRPQKKRQKELEAFRNSLKKGDSVVTAGGIYGKVAEVKENYVLLEVDKEVKIRVDKSSLSKDASDIQK